MEKNNLPFNLHITAKDGNTIFSFSGRTKILSTSPLNGGITTHLTHALNINCMNGAYECEMLGDTYEEDLAAHARLLGLDPAVCTALSTAAWTELCAVETAVFQDLSVTAAVTGGIDANGICPGDPSSYYEQEGKYEMLPPGTINVFLYINQNLTDSAMVRALMICSEAKAAAVSQLLLGSCYSEEPATGSGTDGTVIAADMDGAHTLTDAFQTGRTYRKNGDRCREAGTSEADRGLRSQTVSGSGPHFQIWDHSRNLMGFLYGIPGYFPEIWDYFFPGICSGTCASMP